jgi:hypothetical protein
MAGETSPVAAKINPAKNIALFTDQSLARQHGTSNQQFPMGD